jgi:hypothetical protein
MKNQNITKIGKFQEENSLSYLKIKSDLKLLLQDQKINKKELRLGFIGLAKKIRSS